MPIPPWMWGTKNAEHERERERDSKKAESFIEKQEMFFHFILIVIHFVEWL